MKTKTFATLSLILIAIAVLTACSAGAPTTEVFVEEVARGEPAEPHGDYGFGGGPAEEMEAGKSANPVPTAGVTYQTLPDTGSAPGQAASVDRKIIKNAEVSVLVEDSDIAIDRLTQVVSDVNGYIISSRVWYQPHARWRKLQIRHHHARHSRGSLRGHHAPRARISPPRAG